MIVCLYSCLSYPAWKSYPFRVLLYFYLCPVWLYHIFPRCLIKDTNFEKKIKIKCIFIFSTNFVWDISHSMNNSAEFITNVHRSSYKISYSCQILMKLEFPRQIFEKSSNTNYHKKSFSRNPIFLRSQTDGRMDRQTDRTRTISGFSQFLERD
jgi:hypothetical protein